MPGPGKIECPKCEQTVDVVDDEYALHYVVMNVMCTMSKREIDQERSVRAFDMEVDGNGENNHV